MYSFDEFVESIRKFQKNAEAIGFKVYISGSRFHTEKLPNKYRKAVLKLAKDLVQDASNIATDMTYPSYAANDEAEIERCAEFVKANREELANAVLDGKLAQFLAMIFEMKDIAATRFHLEHLAYNDGWFLADYAKWENGKWVTNRLIPATRFWRELFASESIEKTSSDAASVEQLLQNVRLVNGNWTSGDDIWNGKEWVNGEVPSYAYWSDIFGPDNATVKINS